MNSISGRIIGTDGKGIVGVTVVVYDVDITETQADVTAALQAGNPDGIDRYSQALFALIYGARDNEEDPVLRAGNPAADRIGSVLTGNDGSFRLAFDDEAFRIHDSEERPDFLIVVLAPDEEGTSLNAGSIIIPMGKPEFERIMHLSVFPLRNAGRNEELVIRIPQATLNRFRLNTETAYPPHEYVSQLADAGHRRRTVHDVLRTRLNLDEKVQKRRQYDTDATAFVANLSAVPRALREADLFVGRGDDLGGALSRARELGIAQRLIPHSDPLVSAADLRLSDANLEQLGVTDIPAFKDRLRAGEQLQMPLNPLDVCRTLQDKIGGTELIEATRLLDAARTAHQQRLAALNNSPENDDNPGGGDDPPEPPEDDLSPEDLIRELVLAEVRAMNSSHEAAAIPQAEAVRRAMEALKPPTGPSNMTAVHDFNHLQMAFPDVWAEAFDRDVTELIKQLHIEYRKYEDGYIADDSGGGDTSSIFGIDGINPDELGDLKDYTELMSALVGDIAGAEERPLPSRVSDLISDALTMEPSRRGTVRVNGGGRVEVRGGGSRRTSLQQPTTEPADDSVEELWSRLSVEQQEMLIRLANDLITEIAQTPTEPTLTSDLEDRILDLLGTEGSGSVKAAITLIRDLQQPHTQREQPISRDEKLRRTLAIISRPEGKVTRVQRLLAELAQRLSEPHSFRVFQKNSVNFGIVTTYRQEWTPQNYQVGDLVGTLPLAPGERRKYTKKIRRRKSRAEKENEKSIITRSDERAITSRSVADIIDKAATATNFEQSISANLSGSIGVFSIGANSSSQFQRNQSVESQRVKKAYHEAVRKAANEYHSEHALEVSTETADELESTGVSEISNPNNEITVTYLFYELERQYTVNEHLHRLTPVILVAQEVENPDLGEDWILANEWIIRRNLLDSSFEMALDYIAEGLISDEVGLEVTREHFETQKTLVEELALTVDSLNTLQDTLRNSLVQTSEQEKLARVADKRSSRGRRRGRLRAAFGFGPPPGISGRIAGGSAGLGFGRRYEDPAVLEARREALETRLEFLEGTLEDSRNELTRAESALEKAAAELTAAIKESFTRRNLVSQLRIHIKENILHYMQAIWSYEKPDQRFFRLYDLPVSVPMPDPGDSGSSFTFTPVPEGAMDAILPNVSLPGDALSDQLNVRLTMPPPGTTVQERRLHEIADLDNLLGFKGNYMIFPLKECTYITDFMMQDYVDDYFGIREPGPEPLANISTEELLTYAESIWHADETSDNTREALTGLIRQRLVSPKLEDEVIVVSTGQLFIEALKGEHALLEDFKEQHRAMDVLKTHEETVATRLENLRRAARMVAADQDLDDPDVDKRIEIQGNTDLSITE